METRQSARVGEVPLPTNGDGKKKNEFTEWHCMNFNIHGAFYSLNNQSFVKEFWFTWLLFRRIQCVKAA